MEAAVAHENIRAAVVHSLHVVTVAFADRDVRLKDREADDGGDVFVMLPAQFV